MIKITRRKVRNKPQWKYIGVDDNGKYAAVIAYPGNKMTDDFDSKVRARIKFVLGKESNK